MRGKVNVHGAAPREQLLALAQRRGHAHQALALFIPEASAAVHTVGVKAASAAALSLLNAAVEQRLSQWTQALAAERESKRQRVGDSRKNDVVFAAKLAQCIVKTHAATNTAAVEADEMADLVVALDLACVALYVVCTLEHVVRLGDLVVDNLLYQVAKKYAEIPKMREAASCVAACVHVRLWDAHMKLCNGSRDGDVKKSQFMVSLQDVTETGLPDRVANRLELLAELPRPNSCHTAQFARLLLGHTNTCVTLLSAAQNYQAILLVAETTFSPWLGHLRKLPGDNSKLASSYSDRTFRILWKCAAAVDGAGQKLPEATSGVLRFRSSALSFMLKCSNYTSTYFIQQAHRVGVQHERASRRSQQGLLELIDFYNQSASALAQTHPSSSHIYTSDSLQWEYIQWLEHFALICELAGMDLMSAMILETAAHYVQIFGKMGEPIQSCLLFSIAAALFTAAGSEKWEDSSLSRGGSGITAIDKRLESDTGRILRNLAQIPTTSDKWTDQCEKAARVYLKKLEPLAPFRFASLVSQDNPGFVPFMTRCLKRSSTKVYNYTISVQHSAKYQLYHQVVACYGEMCKAVNQLRSGSALSDTKVTEALLLEESRLHRMAVILSVRCCVVDSSKATQAALHAISHHVNLVRELLDEATVDQKSSKRILQGVLGDLKSIARECYSCATRCYKVGNYEDTISALIGAFELAESYLEYVMCSNFAAEDIHKAHGQLKVDAIAALLAHCYRELGRATESRIFTGLSLLYCGDINEISHGSVDKFVSCILKELKQFGEEAEHSLENELRGFVDNATHAFKSRHIPEDQIMILWCSFRSAFERASAQIMADIRASGSVERGTELSIQLCSTLEKHLDGVLLKLKIKATDCEPFFDILMEVSQTLAKRKQVYCSYYTKRDLSSTMEDLLLVHRSLGAVAENIHSFADVVDADLGGIFGWRGVIAMEIALITSYAGATHVDVAAGRILISEESAIADIERCLTKWKSGNASGFLFDGPHAICCLVSICNTLSLTSFSVMENTARQLLKMYQLSATCEDGLLNMIPPPVLGLLGTSAKDNVCTSKTVAVASSGRDVNREMILLDQIDKDISLATNHLNSRAQACQHLLDAITTLGDLKFSMKQRPTATAAKAIGFRELFVHAILSDIHFREGRSTCAIFEAKAALRICWKMAKKFTASSSPANAAYFELPPEISSVEYPQRNSAHLLYFMAIECSSWDILLAAKVSLCRVASFYSLTDQPHRAASYLTEAMRLVGGLNLCFFPREPFYEYAKLELSASHLEKAKAAISLLSSDPGSGTRLTEADRDVGAEASTHHSCAQADLAFIEQKCNEISLRGDVHLSTGELQVALSCYSAAIDALSATEASSSKLLGTVRARCWRKYTQLQSQISDYTDSTALETILISMKKLKRAMKFCSGHLERVKCMLELGRINATLLRSSSPRVFTSLNRTIDLLEEAYILGDHLGIPHLSQGLRTALGIAYFAEIEERAREEVDSMDGGDRTVFLSWASSVLLANGGSADAAEPDFPSGETDSAMSPKEVLTMELGRLASGPGVRQEVEPHQQLREMTRTMTDNIRQLPDNWLIVSLTIGLSSELVISRFPTNGCAPISFCLPKVSWTKYVDEMDTIIQESRELLSGHTAKEACSWSTEQKKEWWSSRELLNARIEKSICSMQEALGFWRCLLVSGASTTENQSVQRCWDMLVSSKAGPIKLAERNLALLRAISDVQTYLSDSEVIDGLKHIAAEIEMPLSDSMAHEALQMLRTRRPDLHSCLSEVRHVSRHQSLTNFSPEKIAKMKVAEIRQLLATEGISTDGLKKALIERLLAARDAALFDKLKPAAGSIDREFSTILILNHQLQQFPWEGIDVMGICSGVTRMPSLDLIVRNAKRPSSVRRDQVRFLLNPAGDLKSTQNQVGPILEGGMATYGWEGVVGEIPDPDELRNYLSAADLYIYCGHGSGEAYLHRDKVLSLQSKCSAALLFGCSSGRLEREGIFGPSGAVLAYLRAGSPAVLAMLWDVTDRDTDQLSVKVLQEWLLTDSGETDGTSLAQVLQDSRGVCKLKYLNGHAAVCYGLPLYVAKS